MFSGPWAHRCILSAAVEAVLTAGPELLLYGLSCGVTAVSTFVPPPRWAESFY